MYIIVVGGGKVGYYLTKTLVNEGYEVLLIEKNPSKVATFTERFGAVVLQGDGAEAETLRRAGAARADVVIAATGEDEDNLVICQVAKKKFGAKHTIARVNNPKNEEIFKRLGIDTTISVTNIILSYIEQNLPDREIAHLLTLRHAELAIIEAKVSPRSPYINKPLREVELPPDVALSAVIRNGELIIPTPDTQLAPGDDVIALARRESEDELRAALSQ
ncbi:TrkA-N domain protein [Thermobaculum terrenum ATCC BAA-798]|uniref:Trk system potassium uptake protein TrkA n=1 Tax=Thermobaculum terrenum (strain ATCC BAA-798 / CCMEE 7001 / YNP1) TaxID=525904 RepID=D1CFL7_THET1|nr:TrkA family potassium uptake protein [Thermobaculum terrenum]ACZ41723.1 TrkA-N domain protein [Thermobaculum terrenum ATCC BAA-798]